MMEVFQVIINPLILNNANQREIWRIILVIFIFLLIILALFSLIFDLVKAIMIRQGRKIDGAMINLTDTGLIEGQSDYRKTARRKSRMMLFKAMMIPILLIVTGLIIHFTYTTIIGRAINLWDYEREGFRTIMYVHDWSNIPRVKVFGVSVISDWPALLNKPHFEVEAIVSYIVLPLYVIGGIWLLVTTQAHIARFIRIEYLIKEHYESDISKKQLYDTSAASYEYRESEDTLEQ